MKMNSNSYEDMSPYELLRDIEITIAANTDNRTKEIGDKVKVWDGSANMDKHSKLHRAGIDPLFENIGIIIEKDCNIMSDEAFHSWGKQIKSYKHNNYRIIMDILIKFPSGEEVYCASSMVQRIDNNLI